MTHQDDPHLTEARDSPSAPRDTAPPEDPAPAGPGPLPAPAAHDAADAAAGSPTPPGAPGSPTLQTPLFAPLSLPDGAARAAALEELSPRAPVSAPRARGDGTRRAYRSAWRHQYDAWCRSLGREPL